MVYQIILLISSGHHKNLNPSWFYLCFYARCVDLEENFKAKRKKDKYEYVAKEKGF